jgi:lysophospholipase L1-like esterase
MVKRTFLFISLGLNVALIIGASFRYYYTHSPAPISSTYNYRNGNVRQAVYNQMPVDSNDIVFVGNSITEGFPVYELFPGVKVKNRGISGNWTYQVIARLPQIVAAHPRKIFLEMGINDLIFHVSVDSILTNYRKAIEIVQKGSANRTELYINSLTPTTYGMAALNPAIKKVNDSLQHLCMQSNIHYINLYIHMVNNNAMDPNLTVDGLHYNAKAYRIWWQQIKAFIQ